MLAATIKLFLPTGDATGIRTAEISNWTDKQCGLNVFITIHRKAEKWIIEH